MAAAAPYQMHCDIRRTLTVELGHVSVGQLPCFFMCCASCVPAITEKAEFGALSVADRLASCLTDDFLRELDDKLRCAPAGYTRVHRTHSPYTRADRTVRVRPNSHPLFVCMFIRSSYALYSSTYGWQFDRQRQLTCLNLWMIACRCVWVWIAFVPSSRTGARARV